MSLESYWGSIPKTTLASDLPDDFVGQVTKLEKKVGKQGGDVLYVTVKKANNVEFVTTYKIPKAWTGKGQGDMLKECIEKLGFKSPAELLDKVFKWRRMELEGPMKGFARHYPVELVKGKIN